ncbi:MAG: FHA domain-containing protein [bacterium]
MLRLRLEKGAPAGAVFALKQGETLLGRSHSAGIRLESPDISGTHAKVSVKGDVAILENLSRFGIRVNDADITGPVTLTPGQRIVLGKGTVLIVESDAVETSDLSAPATIAAGAATQGTVYGKATSPAFRPVPVPVAAPAHEADTGKGIPEKSVLAADDKTRAMPSGTGAEAEPLSRADWTSEVGASGETRAMQTRAAAPEEIEFLKAAEQKKIRNRVTLGVLIAVPLLILAIIVSPRTPPPEREFEWPKSAAGEYMDALEPSPSGGLKDGGFDLCFPGTPGFKKRSIAGGVAIECLLGRDLNVPMKLYLQEEMDKKFAGMDRAGLVSDWMQQMSVSGGRWNFDKPSPSVVFIGKDNGIPAIRVMYQRDGDGSWFGVAMVYQYGIRRVAVRAEAPSIERVRAEKILSVTFVRPSIDYLRAYWKPVEELPKTSEAEILHQVRQELDRMAPATWMEIENLLAGLLTKAVKDDNKDVENEAVALLSRLRERESLWFNSQQLAFDAAVMQGNKKKAMKVAEFSKGIFSHMEDNRYFTVRKWKTEL